jgi:hypothetical protein
VILQPLPHFLCLCLRPREVQAREQELAAIIRAILLRCHLSRRLLAVHRTGRHILREWPLMIAATLSAS